MKNKLDKKSSSPASKSKPASEKAKSQTKQPKAKAGKTGKAASARKAPGASKPDAEISFEEFSISLIKPGEKKERLWRTKNFPQLAAQREFGFPDMAPELPGEYHHDKLVLMPKDPEYMFCYWELTPSLLGDKEKEKQADGTYRETLKINWESKSLFEPNFTFIPVFFWARKWYFGVPQVGQRYQVELGWLSDTGHFISIIRSNLSELPESWANTQKRLSGQGDVLAYSSRATRILGSSEHLAVEDLRSFAPEWNLSSESLTSSSWSRAQGQAQAAPQKGAKPAKPAPAPATLPKNARLEISGKVLPGVKVLVGGKSVGTDAQGRFRSEFPYDQSILKLELVSASGACRSFAYNLKEMVLT